jgi:hypothetical protein
MMEAAAIDVVPATLPAQKNHSNVRCFQTECDVLC